MKKHSKPSEDSVREIECMIADPWIRRRLRVRASGCHQCRIKSVCDCEALLAPGRIYLKLSDW